MEKELNRICGFCGAETELHYCDYCGKAFCAECFAVEEGHEAYDNMLQNGGYIFCPECYRRTAPQKRVQVVKGKRTEMTVWIVTKHIVQSDYTEPHYYSSAADACEIQGIFDTQAKAEEEKARLEALPKKGEDDLDADVSYYTVAPHTVK